MSEILDEDVEQLVDKSITEHRAMIANDLAAIRDWMLEQSAADQVDLSLSAVQREMAVRVFKRCSHTGSITEQASETELDSYFCDARLLRDLVPPALESIFQNIEDAGRNIRILRTFHGMTLEEIQNLSA